MKRVEIFDISYEGAGVGKLDGQIVFVPKTLPGETVEIEILKQTNKFLLGKLCKVVDASKERVRPVCPYFDICGGCDFQHCNSKYEERLKIQILKNELAKVGFDGQIDFCGSDKRTNYRNKVKFEVKGDKVGYFKPKSHDFFEVDFCPIVDEKINQTLPKIKDFIYENHFENLRNVYIKNIENKINICFLFDKNAKIITKNVKKLENFANFNVFFGFGDILESDKTKLICVLGEAEKDIRAFLQVNNFVANKMYNLLCELVDNKVVVNAYSGQGDLTRLLSKRAKFVYGIEVQNSAHKQAEHIKTPNMKNICGKVEEKLKTIKENVDLIVLDPARAGCEEAVLNEIVNRKIKTIAYISCNFSTLVRDIKILSTNYVVKTVKIFDMFPMTARLETLVIMEEKAV